MKVSRGDANGAIRGATPDRSWDTTLLIDGIVLMESTSMMGVAKIIQGLCQEVKAGQQEKTISFAAQPARVAPVRPHHE